MLVSENILWVTLKMYLRLPWYNHYILEMKRFQFSNYDHLNIRLRITHARTHPTHNKSDGIDYLYLAKIHPMSVSMPCWNLQIK